MLFNLLGAHGKEALVLDAYHRHVRTFLKDHRLTRTGDGQERRLSSDEALDTASLRTVGKLGLEQEPEPEPEPATEPQDVPFLPQASENFETTLVPTVSLAPADEPGMAPGVIQPPSTTDGDLHDCKLSYVAWDYHARTPVAFGTVFKEKALECLGEQSVRSLNLRCAPAFDCLTCFGLPVVDLVTCQLFVSATVAVCGS